MRPPDNNKVFNVALRRKCLPTPALDQTQQKSTSINEIALTDNMLFTSLFKQFSQFKCNFPLTLSKPSAF